MLSYKLLPVQSDLGVEPVKYAMEKCREAGYEPNLLLVSIADMDTVKEILKEIEDLTVFYPQFWPENNWCVGQDGKSESFIGSRFDA